MTEPLWQAIIITLGTIVVGFFSFLASRRARLAKEVAEEVRASITTTNGGSHLKDDIEELKRAAALTNEGLAVVKIALVRIEGSQAAQGRDIERLDAEDAKRASAATEAHGRLHERIDGLLTRRGWRR